jgi:hypothetical protein
VSFQNAIGKELLGLNAGVHPPELLTGIWAKVLAGECWQGVVRNRDAAGAAHRRQHRISPVRDPLGRVSQVVVVTSGAGTESVVPVTSGHTPQAAAWQPMAKPFLINCFAAGVEPQNGHGSNDTVSVGASAGLGLSITSFIVFSWWVV